MSIKNTKKKKILENEKEKEISKFIQQYKTYSKLELLHKSLNSDELSKNEKKAIKIVLEKNHSDNDDNTAFTFNYYPDISDPNFNYKISSKKEFNDYQEKKTNKSYLDVVAEKSDTTQPFTLSNTQKITKNYVSPETSNNGLLLIHGTGSGKTCNGIAIAEQFIPYVLKNNKKIIILAPKSLEHQYRKEIFDIEKYIINIKKSNDYTYSGCTGTKYLELLGIENKPINDVEQFAKDMKKLVDSRYGEIMGYDKFANKIKHIEIDALKNIFINDENEKKKIQKKAIENYFSNTVIIIDEVHNIKSSAENANKVPPIIRKVISCAKNSKLVLMTATPMYDRNIEIIFLLNLLLLNDGRDEINETDVFDKDNNLTPEGKEIIKNASRGYISYVRGVNPYTFPFRLTPDINNDKNVYDLKKLPKINIRGEKIPNKERLEHLKLICSTMSQIQNDAYIKHEKKEVKNAKHKFDTSNDININFNSLRQLSTMCFPTEDYGDSGLRSCFNVSVKNSNASYTYKPEILQKYGSFLDINTIGNYSCKFKLIMDYIRNSIGPVFIYLEFIGGGIIPFALCLEQNGFHKYDGNNLLNAHRENISYENKLESQYKKGENFYQANYAMFSGDETLTGNKENVIKSFKSPENKDGKKIKVILVSQAGSEGIDLRGIREVHICDAWWNLNRNEQTIGRSIRNFSHSHLDIKDRNVTIYLHSALMPAKNKNTDKETIDIYMYRIAMQKQLKIIEVDNILRQNAFDCYLNQHINNRSIKKLNTTLTINTSQNKTVKYNVGDEPYSHMCNYGKNCEYKCEPDFEINDNDINKDTFTEYFINDDIKYIKTKIKQFFRNQSVCKLNELYGNILNDTKIKKVDKIYVYIALQEILDKKETIIGTYNRQGYLTYNNTYYLFTPFSKSNKITLQMNEHPILYKNEKQSINPLLISTKKTIKKKAITYALFEEKIEKSVEKLKHDINKNLIYLDDKYWSNKMNNIEQILYDVVVDELKNNEQEQLLQIIIKEKKNNKPMSSLIYNSIEHNLITYNKEIYYKFFKNNQVKYYYLRKESNEFIEPTTTFIKKIKDIDNSINKKNINYAYSTINGYMSDSSFKLVNNHGKIKTSSGSICIHMDKPMIINLINEILGYQKYNSSGIVLSLVDDISLLQKNFKRTRKKKKTDNILKIHKEGLCFEIQLLLRYKEKYDNNNLIWFVRNMNTFQNN